MTMRGCLVTFVLLSLIVIQVRPAIAQDGSAASGEVRGVVSDEASDETLRVSVWDG